MKIKLPTADELDKVIQSFPMGNIPFHRGYNYIPGFKKHIFSAFGSKLAVTAAITCSDILTAQWPSKFRLDHKKYQEFITSHLPEKGNEK